MKHLARVLCLMTCCLLITACSGEEEKTAPPPKVKKEVATPYDTQINVMNQAKDLSSDIEAKQKAHQEEIEKAMNQ